MGKDYYQILGMPRNAADADLKKAYRKLAMQYHPDRNPGKEKWANEKFKEINEAYGVLGDPEKRAQYDQFGTVGNVGDIFGSAATRTTFEDLMKEFAGAGLRSRGFTFSSGRSGGRGRRTIRFESSPGDSFNLDEIFGQTRKARQQDIRYELTITTEEATKGTRKMLTRQGRKLEVKIPPGVKTGSTIKLSRARQVTDSQPGDILIHIKVK